MKKILALLLVTTLIFVSCEGDQGPPGEEGLPGIQGQVFEADPTNFQYEPETNLYSTIINFGDYTDFEVLDTDAVLIYRLEGVLEGDNGDNADLWSLLPQTFFTNQGTIVYTFEHSFFDAEIFIDGNYDMSNLDAGFTQEQIFRIVIIPNEVAAEVNTQDLNEVMNAINIDSVEHIDLKN